MTLVAKRIGQNDYLYYQDSLPGGKVITTFIGNKQLAPEDFAARRDRALPLHVFKLYKLGYESSEPQYHFESQPAIGLGTGKELELLKLSYRQIRGSLTESEVAELERNLFVKYVHGTTAIEGNTLSESEARSVLLSDLTPKDKSVSETLEVANYKAERAFTDNYAGEISEKFILQIHRLLMNGVRLSNGNLVHAGEYRKTRVVVRDADYAPQPPVLVESSIRYVIDEYNQGVQRHVHPIELASIFHVRFEEVHPFEDGNGRVGREILNFMLRTARYPEVTVGVQERNRYRASLRDGDKGNFVPMLDFVIDRIYASVAYTLASTGFLRGLREARAQRRLAKRATQEEYGHYVEMLESLRNRGASQITPQPLSR